MSNKEWSQYPQNHGPKKKTVRDMRFQRRYEVEGRMDAMREPR